MNALAAMTELVIAARERGDIDDAKLRRACKIIELRIERIRDRQKRRGRGCDCEKCGARSRVGLLCRHCLAEAPDRVRFAFRDAAGLEGMRIAAQIVRGYARGAGAGERAA